MIAWLTLALACRPEPPNQAAALAWGGHVDTDVQLTDLASGDYTLAAHFFAQHPRGLFGPVFAENGGGTLFAGTWTYSGGQQYLLMQVGSQAQAYPVDLPAETWHHLALVRRGAQVELWFDGLPLSPTIPLAAGDPELPTGTLRLGRRTTGRSTVFGSRDRTAQLYGLVDDVAVFERALSGVELDELAREPRMSDELPSDLVAAYVFDERLPDGGPLPPTHQRAVTFASLDLPWEGVGELKPAMSVVVSPERDPVEDRGHALPPFHLDTYYLPFAPGTEWRVGQGYGGDESHYESAAFSLDLDVEGIGSYGAVVTAATTGWVRTFDPNETSAENKDGNNKARLRAGLEEQLYLHIKRDSVYDVGLALGDDVLSGEPFAQVGDFRPGAGGDHLHWTMYTDGAWIPAALSDWYRFDDVTGLWEYVERGIPQKGDLLLAGGSNTVPAVHILEPVDGLLTPQTALGIGLEATAADVEDGAPCCGIAWYSTIDGFLGAGTSLQTSLSPGVHEVIARVIDVDGAATTDRVTVTVTETAPVVTIVAAPGPDLVRDVPYTFVASAPNPANPTQDLCASVVWASTVPSDDGTATGCSRELAFPTAGSYTVTASLVYGGGTVQDTVSLEVADPPGSGPPVVSILAPTSATPIDYLDVVQLRGAATDPDGDTDLTWRWIAHDADGSVHDIGAAATVDWVPDDDLSFNCGGTTATLRLEVTDSDGMTGTAETPITVGMPPC